MALDAQFQRTTGTVYGELMRDSGISLTNGTYVSERTFVSRLINNGVGTRASRLPMMDDLIHSLLYGDNDDILTGVQRLPRGRYTFNPWRELSGDPTGDTKMELSKAAEQNPRAIVRKMQKFYSLYDQLPRQLQAEFLQMLQAYPCELEGRPGGLIPHLIDVPDLYKMLPRLYDRMRQHVHEERLEDFNFVINLMAQHNFCVDKGNVLGGQIDSLLSYDAKTVPTSWQQVHLKPEAIAEKRTELNRLLRRRNIRTPKIRHK